jgi:hypothetical protein
MRFAMVLFSNFNWSHKGQWALTGQQAFLSVDDACGFS